MAVPSDSTVKRLFAVSGNRCAFPKCKNPLVDAGSGKVTGRICHIKARSVNGPRYDPAQTDEERHGFKNLMLMCPLHHDVIDADEESYTVDRLKSIKAMHEEETMGFVGEPTNETVLQLIANIFLNTVTQGSIVTSYNQMGGQTAHSITNVGPQPRVISQAAADALLAELRRFPKEEICCTAPMGDMEAFNVAHILFQLFKAAGWDARIAQVAFTVPIRETEFLAPMEKESYLMILNWLENIGMSPKGILRPLSRRVEIIVGSTN